MLTIILIALAVYGVVLVAGLAFVSGAGRLRHLGPPAPRSSYTLGA